MSALTSEQTLMPTYRGDAPRTPMALVIAVLLHILLLAALLVYFWKTRPPPLSADDHVFELVSQSPAAESASAPAPSPATPSVKMPQLPSVPKMPPLPPVTPTVPKSAPPLPTTKLPTPIAATQPTSPVETYQEWLKQHPMSATSSSTSHTQPTRPVPHVGVDSTAIDKELKSIENSNPNGSQSGSPSKGMTDNYLAGLRARLQAAYENPPSLLDAGLTAVVEITINADGQVTERKIVRSSGNATFDEAVQEALDRVTVVDPPPNGAQTFVFNFQNVAG
ncbi:MAG: TonB family protein [Opitutales bacterium]|jgi:colicin import membrane protein